MKFRKTLKFMVQNPTPMFLYFLICWILFSALSTIADDPFIHGALPDAADEARDSVKGLPWSLWKLCTALSLMVEEIVRDLSHVGIWFVILPVLIIGYFEARASIKGIDKERQVWMDWYGRQQKAKSEGTSYQTPPLTENGQTDSYLRILPETVLFKLRSPIQLVLHFLYWIIAFTILDIFLMFKTIIFEPNSGIVEALHHFIRFFPQFVIPAAILSLLSSFRETRGFLKGITAERKSWMEWYNRQHDATIPGNNFEEPPSSEQVRVGSYFKTVIETVIFMLRNLKPILIHFTSWVLGITVSLIISVVIMEGRWVFPTVQEIVRLLLTFTVPAAIFAYIISYREAKGNLKGIALEQQKWNMCYRHLQQANPQENVFEELISSEKTQSDSYFMVAQKTLSSMIRKPQQFLIHLTCWISGFVLVYGITNLLVIEGLPDFIQILLVFILAFISSYQEAKGNLNGINSQRHVWIEWCNRQQEAKIAESPPMLEVF